MSKRELKGFLVRLPAAAERELRRRHAKAAREAEAAGMRTSLTATLERVCAEALKR